MTNSIYSATKGDKGDKGAEFSGSYLTNLFQFLLGQRFSGFPNDCQSCYIEVPYAYIVRHICYVEASSTRQTICLWHPQTEFVSALKETIQLINCHHSIGHERLSTSLCLLVC